MPLAFCEALLALALITLHGAPATRQDVLLPLPRVSLDTYPAAAREPVSRADREAAARSTDPAAVGALAREPAAEPAAELGLGRIAAAEGRHDAAVAHLERAIALFPEWGAAHY